MDDPSEYVDFMVKYKDWISIKRLGIRPDTPPREVVHHLAGIRATVDGKSFPLLGIKTAVLDACANSITSGMRKGYDSLATAITKLGSADAKKAIEESCPEKELAPVASTYLLSKVITNLGYDTGINQILMSKIYKDLKPPKKSAGRKAKTDLE